MRIALTGVFRTSSGYGAVFNTMFEGFSVFGFKMSYHTFLAIIVVVIVLCSLPGIILIIFCTVGTDPHSVLVLTFRYSSR